MTDYRPLLPILVEAAGLPAKPPRGRTYGLKAVHADFESSRGFIWPFPGGRATSPKKPQPGGACPAFEGDGLCVAFDASGAAQGGHRLSTVLIVSFTQPVASDGHKARVAWADVLAVVDVQKLCRGAVLRGAVLRGAVLRGADLRGADLRDADLRDAVLYGVYLRGAVLSDRDLADLKPRGAFL